MKIFWLLQVVMLVFGPVLSISAGEFKCYYDDQLIFRYTPPVTPGPQPQPTPPPAPQGKWSEAVRRSIPVNLPFNQSGGSVFNIPIGRGSTTYFLLDQKGFGIPWSKSTLIVRVEDMSTINPARFLFRVLELNASDDEMYVWKVVGESSGMYQVFLKQFTQVRYDAGVRFLLEAVETGADKTTLNVKWW